MARRDSLCGLTLLIALAGGSLCCNRTPKQVSSERFPVMATKILLVGNFRAVSGKASGDATVYQLSDGGHVIRFANFSSAGTTDLHVYLSPVHDSGDSAARTNDNLLDLGPLKHAAGGQNYDLPKSADPHAFRSAIIGSTSGTVFAVASLDPPSMPLGHGYQLP